MQAATLQKLETPADERHDTRHIEGAAHFSAVSLEKVLDLLIEAKKEQALTWKESKKELLSNWHSLIEKGSSNN